MHTDTWAVSPVASGTFYRAAAAIAASGAVTLLQTYPGPNGIGYKLSINSTGDDSVSTYTIVGEIMGELEGVVVTKTQLGGNTGTATTSTDYWRRIDSITVAGGGVAGAAVGDVSIGTALGLALPRTRIRGVHYVGAATAGSVAVNMNSTTGTLLLKVDTPATATFAEYVNCGGGLLVGRSAARVDFGIVTLTQVSFCTFFCS